MITDMAKRINPAAYVALANALAAIYWYKKDFARFVKGSTRRHPELVRGLDFDDKKRVVAQEFVDRLQANEARYSAVTIALMIDIAQMEEFPTLARQEDSAQLLAAAQEAVADLATWTRQHLAVINTREHFAAERAESEEHARQRRAVAVKLAALKERFAELDAMPDRQAAGRQFEPLLSDLFRLFKLKPRLAYKIRHEQLDGSLTFDTDDYIVEAKW